MRVSFAVRSGPDTSQKKPAQASRIIPPAAIQAIKKPPKGLLICLTGPVRTNGDNRVDTADHYTCSLQAQFPVLQGLKHP